MNIGKCLTVALCGGLLACACACAPIPPPPPSLDCKSLPVGAQEQTQAVRQALVNLRYQVGPPDGTMNSGAVAALRAFQRDMGLAESGRADKQTLEALGFCSESVSAR